MIGENKDDVIGILLAKDLLRYYAGEEEFNVRDMLRPAVFIPESKRLNVLLQEFRANRNHMAIVVDEYGGVAGLVTIEDVLEQIVGDIEDEYDFDEAERQHRAGQAAALPRQGADRDRRLQRRASAPSFSDEEFDTVGGLVHQAASAACPSAANSSSSTGCSFQVLRADSRRAAPAAGREKTRTGA